MHVFINKAKYIYEVASIAMYIAIYCKNYHYVTAAIV